MNYELNFPDGFNGKDEKEKEYLVHLQGSVVVSALDREEAREIVKHDLLFKLDEIDIDDVELN